MTLFSVSGKTREEKRRARGWPVAWTALLVAMALTSATSANAITSNGLADDGSPIGHKRPTLWAPTYAQSQMGYEGWGNVAYWFNWDLAENPSALRAWVRPWDMESLEIGWKSTGGDNCSNSNAPNTAGFPDNVFVGVDATESDDDAILFVGNMDVVAFDQQANPGKVYSAWWSCSGPFDPNSSPFPYFQVQAGSTDRWWSSFAHATLTYIPSEEGRAAFPSTNPDPNDHATAMMDAPWIGNPNFEGGTSESSWYRQASDARRLCSGASPNEGNCYLFVDALGSPSWIAQTGVTVKNQANQTTGGAFTRMQIGSNTNFQYEGAFRCPTLWNTTDCVVTIWLKGDNGTGWNYSQHARTITIPRDDQWYFTAIDDWAAGGDTSTFSLWINTNGHDLDVDSQWVSSGI